jgi:photosystem II stability/assembly factor-like uncharacterized protein
MSRATVGLVAVAVMALVSSVEPRAQDDWVPLDTGTTQDLNAVHFVDEQVGYVVGVAGTILKTTDGGATWADVSPGLNVDLQDLYFFDANTGVVVGAQGRIGRTTDGGATWSLAPSGTSRDLYSVSFSGDVGIAGAESQAILRSDDRGQTWDVVQSGFVGFPFYGAHMRSSTDGFVVGQNAIFQPNLGMTDDGGQTWDYVAFYFDSNEGSNRDVRFLDEQTGLTVGVVWDGRGAVSRSVDGGQTWTSTLFPQALYGLDFASAQTGYAVGDGGAILRTTDGGQTWAPEKSGTAATLYDVSLPSSSTGYAAGSGGTVLRGALAPSTSLALAVTPLDPPVEVFPGESFQFTVQVANTGDEAVTFDLWAEGTHTNSGLSLTRGPRTLTLPAGASREVTLSQRVPLQAPGGAYTYTVFAGTFPDVVVASDGFAVTVLGSEGAASAASETTLPFTLEQNTPNPFGARTVIRYALPEASHVRLRVYDALGQEVAVLVDGYQAAGPQAVAFDASRLSAGVYLYTLEAGTHTSSRRMLLAR